MARRALASTKIISMHVCTVTTGNYNEKLVCGGAPLIANPIICEADEIPCRQASSRAWCIIAFDTGIS